VHILAYLLVKQLGNKKCLSQTIQGVFMIAINSYNPAIATTLNTLNTPEHTPNQNNTTSSDSEQKTLLNNFYNIAYKYDVENINIDDTVAMSQELYNKEEISLKEHMILSFDERNFRFGSAFITEPNAQDGYNLISEFKARIGNNKKLGEEQNISNNTNVLDILMKLNALKSMKPLDIKV